MQPRKLGTTGIEVSEIAFGAWQLGNGADWGAMDDQTARDLVNDAIDCGINLFDTSPNYASTNSERLLGEALVGRREGITLVSKFGHRPEGHEDFSVNWFWTSLEGSLRRLRTDRLDVLLLHNPDPLLYEGTDPLWDALEAAVRQGKVLHYGASLDYAFEIESCLTNGRCEVVEILFNVFHQDARRAFPIIRNHKCGVIVKAPLDSGWLSGRFDASSHFDGIRSRWTRHQIVQRAALVDQLDWLTEDGTPLAVKALAYTLAYDEISCVIPGMRTREQLRSNVSAAGHRLSTADRERIEAFWRGITCDGKTLLPW